MHKVIAIVALTVPSLWAGVTWLNSNKTEEVLDTMLVESNRGLSEQLPFVTIEKQAFDKGFTKSTAESIITVKSDRSSDGEPLEVVMHHDIYHGPVMMTPNGLKTGSSYIRTTLGQTSLSTEAQEVLKLLFKEQEPFVSGVQTGLSGGVGMDMEVAPFSYDANEFAVLTGENKSSSGLDIITFSGIKSSFTTNSERTVLNGSMNIGAAEATEEGGIHVTVAPSVLSINIDELYKGAMLDGSTELSMAELKITDNDVSEAILSGLTISSKAGQENNKFAASTSIGIEKIFMKMPGSKVDFSESKVHLDIGMKGFERDAVLKLIDSKQQAFSSQLAALGNNDPEPKKKKILGMMGSYYTALGEAVTQGVELNADFQLSNTSGKSATALELHYVDAKKLFDLKTIKDLITAVKGQLSIHVDKDMIAGTPLIGALAMPVAMGVLTDTGEAYEALVELSDGQLKVNGELVPILSMLGGMANQPMPWGVVRNTP